MAAIFRLKKFYHGLTLASSIGLMAGSLASSALADHGNAGSGPQNSHASNVVNNTPASSVVSGSSGGSSPTSGNIPTLPPAALSGLGLGSTVTSTISSVLSTPSAQPFTPNQSGGVPANVSNFGALVTSVTSTILNGGGPVGIPNGVTNNLGAAVSGLAPSTSGTALAGSINALTSSTTPGLGNRGGFDTGCLAGAGFSFGTNNGATHGNLPSAFTPPSFSGISGPNSNSQFNASIFNNSGHGPESGSSVAANAIQNFASPSGAPSGLSNNNNVNTPGNNITSAIVSKINAILAGSSESNTSNSSSNNGSSVSTLNALTQNSIVILSPAPELFTQNPIVQFNTPLISLQSSSPQIVATDVTRKKTFSFPYEERLKVVEIDESLASVGIPWTMATFSQQPYALPGDGKAVILANPGAVFAITGEHTLTVKEGVTIAIAGDADIRISTLYGMVEVPAGSAVGVMQDRFGYLSIAPLSGKSCVLT